MIDETLNKLFAKQRDAPIETNFTWSELQLILRCIRESGINAAALEIKILNYLKLDNPLTD